MFHLAGQSSIGVIAAQYFECFRVACDNLNIIIAIAFGDPIRGGCGGAGAVRFGASSAVKCSVVRCGATRYLVVCSVIWRVQIAAYACGIECSSSALQLTADFTDREELGIRGPCRTCVEVYHAISLPLPAPIRIVKLVMTYTINPAKGNGCHLTFESGSNP